MKNFDEISHIVIDVDGVMTDAGIYYDEKGNELKKFCTRDAAGFWALKQSGITVVVLTGRECVATLRRMNELGVKKLYQNVKDKKLFLQTFMKDNGIKKRNVAYVGDDLNDLPPMRICGYVLVPMDACEEVKSIADYICPRVGGSGVVRDVAEHLLKEKNIWEKMIEEVYGMGI